MRTTWNFHAAGQLTFGVGAVSQIGELARRHNLTRISLVTDRRLVEAGLVERVHDSLAAGRIVCDTFSGGEAEPSLAVAEQAIRQADQFQPQAVLGLGGGSNMDLAKITATVLAHGGTPHDYFGFDRVPGPVLPLICVPTTAGTGSEVSHAAVLTDKENEIKVSCLSNWLRPTLAIVDPQLTYSCPRSVAADSGIDALTHAIEAFMAIDFDQLQLPPGETSAYEGRFPLTDCLAEKAIALIGQNLERAVNDPRDLEARNAMSLAATIAGMAFSNAGVTLVHALEYPLGGTLHCSHGAGNGLLLPYVMQFNLPQRQTTLARIAVLLGADVAGLDESQAAAKAMAFVSQLREDIGIPLRIRDLGGKQEQLPGFAEKSFAIQRLMWLNPRKPTEQDLLEILKSAF